jgi:hypothetical protein
VVSPQARREQVALACERGLSKRRACGLLAVARSSVDYTLRLPARPGPAPAPAPAPAPTPAPAPSVATFDQSTFDVAAYTAEDPSGTFGVTQFP